MSGHLNRDQMDEAVRSLADERLGTVSAPPRSDAEAWAGVREELRAHLDLCPGCNTRLESLLAVEMKLRGLQGTRGSGSKRPDCPDEGIWPKVAVGLLPDEEAASLVAHAANCNHCGPLLREATEDLAMAPTEQETAELARYTPEWQRQMAVRMSAASRPAAAESRGWLSWLRIPAWGYALATAVVVVALGVGWWVTRESPLQKTERLLAEAYTEQRGIEMRLPGAAHGQYSVQRGATRTRPPALPEAEALIARKLQESPNDPAWIAEKARYDLLAGDYDAAVIGLSRALEASPDSPDLLISLGVAHFQRGEAGGHEGDDPEAIQLLSRALTKKPGDPVALFDLALALERLPDLDAAVKAWDDCINAEPRGAWADEARSRLADLKKRLEDRKRSAAPMFESPAEFNRWCDRDGIRAQDAADRRIEEYLDVAVKEWLPAYYAGTNADSRRALDSVAALLEDRHGDPWLARMVALRPSQKLAEAAAALSEAVTANQDGEHKRSFEASERSIKLFSGAGSADGRLRAEAQRLIEVGRSFEGRKCLAEGPAVLHRLDAAGQTWTAIQVRMEISGCANMVFNQDYAVKLNNEVLVQTENDHFGLSHVKSMQTAAVYERQGDPELSWAWARRGLRQVWSETYPAYRRYGLMDHIVLTAMGEGRRSLALVAQRSAVEAVEQTPNTSVRAVAHARLAMLEAEVGDYKRADQEYQSSYDLLRVLPASPTNATRLVDIEVGRAASDLSQGRPQAAVERLLRSRALLADTGTYPPHALFYRTLARAYWQMGDMIAVRGPLLASIVASEAILSGAHDDTERVRWLRDTGGSYRLLVQYLFQVKHDPQAALEAWEWFRGAVQRDSSRPLPKLSDIAEAHALPEDHTVSVSLEGLRNESVLSFARLTGGWAVWLFDNRGIVSAWVPDPQGQMDSLGRTLRDLSADSSSSIRDLRKTGHLIYERMVSPLESRLDVRRSLIIEPDAGLSEAPIEALVDKDGSYLGLRYAMTISPGLYVYLRLPDHPASEIRTAPLVVGAPILAAAWRGKLVPLPDAAREAEDVAASLSVQPVLREQASLDEVEKALPLATLFHFAGHAVISSSYAGLILGSSDDAIRAGLLTASQLRRISLPRCRMVVLSACSTERGVEEGFADPESLVRTFLSQGVQNVVASRWPVDSGTTREWMNAFYKELRQGLSVSAAHREAAIHVQGHPATSHPCYWAAFSVYGRG